MNRPNKLHLGQFPTPMHRLDNMSRVLGRNIYIKRDDMTGVSTGGNKAVSYTPLTLPTNSRV